MSDDHDWTFDGHHAVWRCSGCGTSVPNIKARPLGPCSTPPSRWVPPGASEPEPASADHIEAMLVRAGERYRASLAEPLEAEAEAQLQRLRVRLKLDGGGE